MKRRTIIISCIMVIVVSVICLVLALKGRNERLHTAVITVNGKVVKTVDLDEASDETFRVESENGYNTICISDGEISVIEASCPDRICIDHGILRNEYLPIVCLPNKMIIELR